MLLRGCALRMLMSVGQGEGIEGWRTLVRHYEPEAGGRLLGFLASVLNPDLGASLPAAAVPDSFPDLLTAWGHSLEQYHRTAPQKINDEISTAALIGKAPALVRDYLVLNSSALGTSFQRNKQAALQLLLATRSWAFEPTRPQQQQQQQQQPQHQQPAPMQIDGLERGRGRGRGKGKGQPKGGQPKGQRAPTPSPTPRGKSRGKGGKGQHQRPAGAQPPQGYQGRAGGQGEIQGFCGKCGRWGHKASVCRSASEVVSDPTEEAGGESGAGSSASYPTTAISGVLSGSVGESWVISSCLVGSVRVSLARKPARCICS